METPMLVSVHVPHREHRLAAEARTLLEARHAQMYPHGCRRRCASCRRRLAGAHSRARAARAARAWDVASGAGGFVACALSAAFTVWMVRVGWQAARALLASFLGVLLLASAVEAQTFIPGTAKPPVCTVECPEGPRGPQGPKGDPGPRGPKGEPGPPSVPPPVVVRPFDLGFHGVTLDVALFFAVEGVAYAVIYEPTAQAAALINLDTCYAQLYPSFNAGIPGPPLAWKAVQPTGEPFHFAWNHGGAWWSERWPLWLPAVNLRAAPFVIDDPRLGAGTALCRWRDQ